MRCRRFTTEEVNTTWKTSTRTDTPRSPATTMRAAFSGRSGMPCRQTAGQSACTRRAGQGKSPWFPMLSPPLFPRRKRPPQRQLWTALSGTAAFPTAQTSTMQRSAGRSSGAPGQERTTARRTSPCSRQSAAALALCMQSPLPYSSMSTTMPRALGSLASLEAAQIFPETVLTSQSSQAAFFCLYVSQRSL